MPESVIHFRALLHIYFCTISRELKIEKGVDIKKKNYNNVLKLKWIPFAQSFGHLFYQKGIRTLMVSCLFLVWLF